jgi:bifunctional NMN adenylyltransferase/nudix hydrolase
MDKPYKLGVVIGRFQPVHVDHIEQIVIPALIQSEQVVVILGSCNQPQTIKNPFTIEERIQMIKRAIIGHLNASHGAPSLNNLHFVEAVDFPYDNNRWRAQILGFAHEYESNDNNIALFGAEKDASSFYLKMFPLWTLRAPKGFGNGYGSTAIRDWIFNPLEDNGNFSWPHSGLLDRGLHECNWPFIRDWLKSDVGMALKVEHDHIRNYKAQFADYPYPPIFHTVDNVVLYNGYILLIERKAEPGKGLWALPGGFVNAKERVFSAAVRELQEETGLKAKPEWYNPEGKMFDDPNRSQRGRTITTAYLCIVPSRFPAPTVKGMDDASKAQWFPLDKVLGNRPEMGPFMYEDHLDIIREMVERA